MRCFFERGPCLTSSNGRRLLKAMRGQARERASKKSQAENRVVNSALSSWIVSVACVGGLRRRSTASRLEMVSVASLRLWWRSAPSRAVFGSL